MLRENKKLVEDVSKNNGKLKWHFSDVYIKNNSSDFLRDIMDTVAMVFSKYCATNTKVMDQIQPLGRTLPNLLSEPIFLSALDSLSTLEH